MECTNEWWESWYHSKTTLNYFWKIEIIEDCSWRLEARKASVAFASKKDRRVWGFEDCSASPRPLGRWWSKLSCETISKHKKDKKIISNTYCSFKKGKCAWATCQPSVTKWLGWWRRKEKFVLFDFNSAFVIFSLNPCWLSSWCHPV